jgi:regulatory protein
LSESINELNADLFRARDTEREADPRAARIKAMDFLARREYGRAELIGRLAAAGFLRELATETVARLGAEGLQDDRRFSDSYIGARAGRGSGPLRIRQTLIERGIAEDVISDALGQINVDWFEQARAARLKKFGPDRPADFKEKARQMRFLQYRGFDMDQIQHALQADS